ncbi:MAG TPA: hypothetical protein PKY88_12940, partial [Anaerohalosphaeraceae bacterium]|nr:hypothetical protein [Anaerohalosphaeraceae bacterium]
EMFSKQYGPAYLDRLDPGEAESLAFLFQSKDDWLFTSGDAIVFQILGAAGRCDQGISLEEILQALGLTCKDLKKQYRKDFRLRETQRGKIDGITGFQP